MKKILKLFTVTFVTSSSILTVVACGSTKQIKESMVKYSSPTKAKQESDKINNQTVTLNDTASLKYENKTAQADAQTIDDVIVAAGYLNTTQVKDFTFNNTTKLQLGNNTVNYSVKAPDGSKASGKININIKSSDWYKNMKLQGKDKFEAAYDGYYLNKTVGITQDWLNFNSQNPSKTIYFLLPGVTNTKEALKDIDVKDSAGLVFGYPYDDSNIQWAKDSSDPNTYYNLNYITQDSTIGGYATVSKEKATDILNSQNFKNATSDQKSMFQKYNFDNKFTGNLKNIWWNSNHWENLLNNPSAQEKTQDSKLMQDYTKWTKAQLGLNVPLSLIKEKSFVFTKTPYKNIFALKMNFQQNWINNKKKTTTLNDPHWGVNFDVNFQGEKYSSNQIVNNFDNAYLSQQLYKYLQKDKSFDQDKDRYTKVT